MFALARLLVPRRYKPYVDRLLAGLFVGMLVGFFVSAAVFDPIGDNAWMIVFPVTFAGGVVGVVVAWRTRR